MFYVYAHLHPESGIPFYIGKGKKNRAFSLEYRNDFWQKIVTKYGFEHIILDSNLTEKESFELEKYWINRIGLFKSGGTLTNITKGGFGGDTISNHPNKKNIIDKIKLSLSLRPNSNLGGKCCTDEWKEKQSISQSKVKIKATDTITGKVYHFTNSKECAVFFNAKASNVRTCKGKYKLQKRYIIE